MVSVLLEKGMGCHKSPQKRTSNSAEGHMREVTGEVPLGGS